MTRKPIWGLVRICTRTSGCGRYIGPTSGRLTLDRGKIGLSAFRCIMRDPLMSGIPLILETPAPDKALEFGDLAIWVREIRLLYEIQEIGDDEWVAREGDIKLRWKEERDLLNPPKPPKEKKVKKGGQGKKAKGEGKGNDEVKAKDEGKPKGERRGKAKEAKAKKAKAKEGKGEAAAVREPEEEVNEESS